MFYQINKKEKFLKNFWNC